MEEKEKVFLDLSLQVEVCNFIFAITEKVDIRGEGAATLLLITKAKLGEALRKHQDSLPKEEEKKEEDKA